ncbi:MAG TPA: DUF2784 domain-containing protein [Mycobacterium sp.]
MQTVYFAVVGLAVVTHSAFIGYLVVGGFVALRWRRTIVWHVLTAVWAVAIETVDFTCPLTTLERWARGHAGMAPLPSDGFIAHYITGVLYPSNWVGAVVIAVFVVVVTSWMIYWRQGRRLDANRR